MFVRDRSFPLALVWVYLNINTYFTSLGISYDVLLLYIVTLLPFMSRLEPVSSGVLFVIVYYYRNAIAADTTREDMSIFYD